jgi:stage IV sporulation protein FB
MITGYFKYFLMITFIIIFHELGHIIAALYFHFQIDKIIILPFGGLTLFKEKINRPLKEELIIALMGPIFQSFLFTYPNDTFQLFNKLLLIFNLLPIFPLDGSKIVNLLLNYFFSFKACHQISIIISIFFFMFFSTFIKKNLILGLILFFLLIKIVKEVKEHKYIFNKFLLERYQYQFSFPKQKIINNQKYMKRDYRHLFYQNKKYYTEHEFLSNLFDK